MKENFEKNNSVKIIFEVAILKSYFVQIRVKNIPVQGRTVGSVMFFEN